MARGKADKDVSFYIFLFHFWSSVLIISHFLADTNFS